MYTYECLILSFQFLPDISDRRSYLLVQTVHHFDHLNIIEGVARFLSLQGGLPVDHLVKVVHLVHQLREEGIKVQVDLSPSSRTLLCTSILLPRFWALRRPLILLPGFWALRCPPILLLSLIALVYATHPLDHLLPLFNLQSFLNLFIR